MTPFPDPNQKLEQLVHRTLRDLPARQAPRSLEARVLAEIQRRAALPWWRKSFLHWPVAAQAGFLVVSASLVKVAWTLGVWVMAGFNPEQFKTTFAQQFSWLESATIVVHALRGFLDIMQRNIPPLWIYGGLTFFAVLYFTLFGLGAAAYKTVRAQSSDSSL